MDFDNTELGDSRSRDGCLALVVVPCALGLALIGLAGSVFAIKGEALGAREIALLVLIGALLPTLARASYVFVARAFGKRVEPLLPWWLTIGPAALFATAVVVKVALARFAPGDARGLAVLPPLIGAPVILYRRRRASRA